MATRTVSIRRTQTELVDRLRSQRRTWVEIAEELQATFGVNARTAYRLAHGWSQSQAAEEWNRRWPAEPRTFKNFSYWEQWPGSTGHAPSLGTLSRLAEIYGCRVADLLADCPDHRDEDPMYTAHSRLAVLTAPSGTEDGTAASGYTDGAELANVDGWSERQIARLANRVEDLSLEEVSATAVAWAQQAGTATSPRGLLLKLSASLSLAAGDASFSDPHHDVGSAINTTIDGSKMDGIWHSRYQYHSDSRDADFEDEHYLILRQRRDQLTGQSLPHTTGSRVRVRLSVAGSIATGTWLEETAQSGHYRGATYHGTLQLVVDPMGRTMKGRWLGFTRDFDVNSGEWSLSWVGGSTTSRALRDYVLKL